MYGSRVCLILPSMGNVAFTSIRRPLGALTMRSSKPCSNSLIRLQGFASDSGSRASTLRRAKPQQALKEIFMKPASDTPFAVGKAFLAGSSAVALGALCYYGMGLSNEVGSVDRAVLWSDTVKHRIRDTYTYFGGSLIITAASAVAISRNARIMNFLARGSWVSLIGTVVAMMGTGMLCQALPYQEGFGAKQMAWMLHSGVIGMVIAPLTLLGGPLMVRAACYTAGIVGGLSTLAVCAPSDKFLYMGGPLAMGLGVVFISSIGTWFLPATSAIGAGLYSIAMYGGLALFGAFLLYDTQKIIHRAENHPIYASVPFDPINNSVGIYLDTVNIFIRVAMLLAGGGNRRK